MKEFFSERELGKKELKSEELTVLVFNGIISVYQKYQKNLSYEFPEHCPDNEMTCGVNVQLLNASIKSHIPDIETPIEVRWYENDENNICQSEKYALLDFLEFCYSKITDVIQDNYHSYFGHYHHFFPNSEVTKDNFREEINHIFARNGIVFYLDTDGTIKRQLPTDMNNLLQNLIVKTPDERLNELVNTAIENIRKPKVQNRNIALEKIWDAFERIKTFYNTNKKQSVHTLISNIAIDTDEFDSLLHEEFYSLTTIGNKYQIRHFETNKIQIKHMKQVDYLFYRMIALIDICIETLNKGENPS